MKSFLEKDIGDVYQEAFEIIQNQLRKLLPPNRSGFDFQYEDGDNFARISFPELKYGQYEIQYVKSSKTHQEYFKVLPFVLFAFYYKGKECSPEKRSEWLASMKLAKVEISTEIGSNIVLDDWNEHWVFLGVEADRGGVFETNPLILAEKLAKFISITYPYLVVANNEVN
ncbi:MAG: hypothetical protein JEZ06_17320 [Anaerolineaceae bacterium]|nr:hypothetical protein [Anaerolineaceae bacterium]